MLQTRTKNNEHDISLRAFSKMKPHVIKTVMTLKYMVIIPSFAKLNEITKSIFVTGYQQNAGWQKVDQYVRIYVGIEQNLVKAIMLSHKPTDTTKIRNHFNYYKSVYGYQRKPQQLSSNFSLCISRTLSLKGVYLIRWLKLVRLSNLASSDTHIVLSAIKTCNAFHCTDLYAPYFDFPYLVN